jgi:death-on-curing protein
VSEPVWILPQLVRAVHQTLIAEHGGLPGFRDQSLLDSGLARPRQKYAYDSNMSVLDLAAAYSYGLARNSAFTEVTSALLWL